MLITKLYGKLGDFITEINDCGGSAALTTQHPSIRKRLH
jgi:hypothetical protein